MSVRIKPNDVNSVTIEAQSYSEYQDVTLVSTNSDSTKFYCKNIVISNRSDDNLTITLKLDKNIIISKKLIPGEYFNYVPEIIVTKNTPLSINVGPKPDADISVLYIEQLDIINDE